MFGEYVSATSFQNMVKEMILKVSLYNLVEDRPNWNRCDLRTTRYATVRMMSIKRNDNIMSIFDCCQYLLFIMDGCYKVCYIL